MQLEKIMSLVEDINQTVTRRETDLLLARGTESAAHIALLHKTIPPLLDAINGTPLRKWLSEIGEKEWKAGEVIVNPRDLTNQSTHPYKASIHLQAGRLQISSGNNFDGSGYDETTSVETIRLGFDAVWDTVTDRRPTEPVYEQHEGLSFCFRYMSFEQGKVVPVIESGQARIAFIDPDDFRKEFRVSGIRYNGDRVVGYVDEQGINDKLYAYLIGKVILRRNHPHAWERPPFSNLDETRDRVTK